MVTDPSALLVQLARILESVELRYAVGGSIASSFHGEYRATNDIDIVVEVGSASVAPLLNALGSDFHVDREAAESAAGSGGTFTALHLEAFVKVDFFVAMDEKIHRLQLERRQAVELDPAGPPVYFISAEDAILVKLLWYARSDQVLERQLRDVAGILKTRGQELDLGYLSHAASILGVRALLEQALDAAGLDKSK